MQSTSGNELRKRAFAEDGLVRLGTTNSVYRVYGMNYYLPLVLVTLHMLIVLMWGFYEVLHVAITGRWRPSTIVGLMAVSLVFLFLLLVAFVPLPSAIGCDRGNAVEVQAQSTRDPGRVHEQRYGPCSLYFYSSSGSAD